MFRKMLFCAVFAVVTVCGEENYWQVVQRVENYINAEYRTPRANKGANRQLQKIDDNPALTEADKIKELQKAFPGAFQQKVIPQKKENLIHQLPLSWKIHSLALGYDIVENASRTTTVTLSEKYFETRNKSSEESQSKTAKSTHSTDFSTGTSLENRSSMKGELSWNPFKLLNIQSGTNFEFKIAGGYRYNRETGSLSSSIWTQKQQEMFQRERSAIDQLITQTGISKLHLTFTVTLTNDSEENMICDLAHAQIPVYMGDRSCNKNAVPYNPPAEKLTVYSGRQVDVPFRMELDTTTARELISWMEHHEPSIEITRAAWTIRSASNKIPDAFAESGKRTSTTVVELNTADFQIRWDIKLYHENNSRTTLREGLNSIQESFTGVYGNQGIFAFDKKGNLCNVSGVPLRDEFATEDTQKRFMAFIKANGKFLSSENASDLDQYLDVGSYSIYVVDTKDMKKLDIALQEQVFKRLLALVEEPGFFSLKKKSPEQENPVLQYRLAMCFSDGLGTKQDPEKAFEWMKKAADQGYVEAQCNLGVYYQHGIGTQKNPEQAFFWFKKAAEQGYAWGQWRLGGCYLNGTGTEKNLTQAFFWFKKAAEQGHALAQMSVGVCYQHGIGTQKNPEQAFFWYKKSAEQRFPMGQSILGACYLKGVGTEQDLTQGFFWSKKAAEQGDASGQGLLGSCYLDGVGTEQDLTQAFFWSKKGAEQGDALGQSLLGFCYLDGVGTEKNPEQAFFWSKKGAEQGEPAGQNNLGFCYQHGFGTEQDLAQAFFWYKKSAEQGYSLGQCNLGFCYQHGFGTEQDLTQAFFWFKKSAEQGNALGQNNLGVCYQNGFGTERNPAQTFFWYKKSAEQGEPAGQNNLGVCYQHGFGTEQDLTQAFFWYKKSAEQGEPAGQNNLGVCYQNGIGTEKNPTQAFFWYKKSAEQGQAEAQYILGMCLACGYGTKVNLKEAHKWYGKAAEQGHENAKAALKSYRFQLMNLK